MSISYRGFKVFIVGLGNVRRSPAHSLDNKKEMRKSPICQKSHKIYVFLSIIGGFVFVFQGCNSAEYSTFHGSKKSGEQDAILIIAEHNQPNTVICIEKIDQELFSNIGSMRETKFKLIPGKHTITYFFFQRPAITITSENLNISFKAKAGHTYTLKNYSQWDNEYPEKVDIFDFLTMIIDTTESEVVSWESWGSGAFKKDVLDKTGLELTEASEKKAFETNDYSKNKERDAAVCGDDHCEQNESHSDCPADCFPIDIKPTDLSKDDKAVFLNFVYKGQKSGIFFVVNRDVHEKLASLPRSIIYEKGKEKISEKDFIFQKLNNRLQKEKLLPLVKKIKSLTPDVNKQARIAISLVQNIPYNFPIVSASDIDYVEKYPYGVIWEQEAACGEKSDLLLFLLRELGFGTATLIYKKEDHRSVGIKCPDAYDVGDSGYCFVEVTGPKIITDSLSRYEGVGTLTDCTVIKISDGNQLDGVEEEFTDKNLYYDLMKKANAQKGGLERNDYDLFNYILNKYGMRK